ncbi:hypothetical protein [Streptomyces sp. HUAS TT7]|uniref:hypothetical protein n=1 Tax=Streptomyces sp. HUAS TT7 TaxID=3447507 RepID=UPI003F654B93
MTTPPANTTGTDAQSLLETAQGLLASRMEVIQPLASAIAERKRLQALLDAAETAYGAAYADAQAAGWTEGELKQLGAEGPTKRPKGRPRTSPRQKPPAPRTPSAAESSSSASTGAGA